MDVFKGMKIFLEVANQQGFAPAARELNLSTSAISRYIIDLEEWLGVQLFQRTTRKLSLTDDGKLYLDRCQKVVDEVEDIKHISSKTQAEPKGTLHITTPMFIAKSCLQDWLPEYLERYPKVKVELTAVDRFVDLVGEGIDVALRIGELPDSSLIAKRLMDIDLVLVASPKYLKKYGIPKNTNDLKSHNCIVDTVATYVDRWPIKSRARKQKTVLVNGNLRVNSGEIVRSLAIGGAGIALLPRLFVHHDINQGLLKVILKNSINYSGGLFVMYSQRRHVSINVRSFVNHLVESVQTKDH